jgi:competence protein ComEA
MLTRDRALVEESLPGHKSTRRLDGVTTWWTERARIDPGRRGALAVAAVAVLVAAVTGWWVLAGRPHGTAITARPPSTLAAGPLTSARTGASARSVAASAVAAAAVPSPSAAALVVDVVGRVRHPGIRRLPAGSRVADALSAAGGALPDVDLVKLNLARKITDGEQIAVGVAGALASPPVSADPADIGRSTPATASLDLNAATAGQLDTLPGVGPVLAQNILEWRDAHGRFDSVDQLREVSGIGPSKFATLRPLVTV